VLLVIALFVQKLYIVSGHVLGMVVGEPTVMKLCCDRLQTYHTLFVEHSCIVVVCCSDCQISDL